MKESWVAYNGNAPSSRSLQLNKINSGLIKCHLNKGTKVGCSPRYKTLVFTKLAKTIDFSIPKLNIFILAAIGSHAND